MASVLYTSIKPQVDQLSMHYRTQFLKQFPSTTTLSGVPQANLFGVLTSFIASVIDVLRNVNPNGTPLPPNTPAPPLTPGLSPQKTAVIEAVMDFYNKVLKTTIAGAFGNSILFTTFIEPAIEKQLPVIVGGIYDSLVGIMGRTGGTLPSIPTQPTTPTPSVPSMPPGWSPY